jgi:hypothetical protein
MIVGIALAPFTFGASATIGVNVAVGLGVASNAMKIKEVKSEYQQGLITKKSENLQLAFAGLGVAMSGGGSLDTVAHSVSGLSDMAFDYMSKNASKVTSGVSRVVKQRAESIGSKMIDENTDLSIDATPKREFIDEEGNLRTSFNPRHNFYVPNSGDIRDSFYEPSMSESLLQNRPVISRIDSVLTGVKSRIEEAGNVVRGPLEKVGALRSARYGGPYTYLEKVAQVGIGINRVMSSTYNENIRTGQLRDMNWDTAKSELLQGGVGFATLATVGVVAANIFEDYWI